MIDIPAHKRPLSAYRNRIFSILLVFMCFGLFSCSATSKNQHSEVLPEYVFSPKENGVSEFEQNLAEASEQQKLMLVVFGAQWCHDSNAMSEQFSNAQFNQALKERYVVQFVDVGHLDTNLPLLERVDQPIYYATPTAVILEPNTKQVLNKHELLEWSNAASKKSSDFVDYYLDTDFLARLEKINELKQHPQYADIKAWEAKQAERLQKGYEKLGPMLTAYENNKDGDHKVFYELWDEVRAFRVNVSKQLASFSEQLAKSQAAHSTNSNIELSYPTYELSWE